MDLFDTLHDQIDAMRVPLYAVTVTAAARINTPLVAILHWHGFRRATPLVLPGITLPPRPVPSSAIQIDAPWRTFDTVERALLDAAWRLGAWDLERIEARACNEIGASAGEALACRKAFGDYRGDDAVAPDPHLVDGAPDRDALMHLAAERGYLRWLFRPVKGGLWHTLDESDDTLEADGGRRPPCPIAPLPRRRDQRGRTVYRLGRVHRVIVLR
jgi:hypothetical protein